ncbi:MAG: hypothetical protein ACOC0V_00485 [Oceanicaulis sp.]
MAKIRCAALRGSSRRGRPVGEIDFSDIPELDEAWFAKAEQRDFSRA